MWVLQLAVSKMVDLHAWRPSLACGIAARPKAGLAACLEAKSPDYAAALWHFQPELTNVVGRRFLQLLDGTRDRTAPLKALKAEFPEHSPEELQNGVEENLKGLYRAALLEA